MTVLLQGHDHMEDVRREVAGNIANGGVTSDEADYKLGGLQGVPKYAIDYSAVLTNGLTGNLAVTYLGSYHLRYDVASVNYEDGTARVDFHVWNSSTLESATHPPVIGYSRFWSNTIGQWLNSRVPTGPMSKTTQDFYWAETIDWR